MISAHVSKCSCGNVVEMVAEDCPHLVGHDRKPELISVEKVVEMKWCENNGRCKE